MSKDETELNTLPDSDPSHLQVAEHDPASGETDSASSIVALADVALNDDGNENTGVSETLEPMEVVPSPPTPIQLFMEAAQMGNTQVIKEYLDNGIVKVNDRDVENVSALHWAAINNRLSTVKYLVSKGAEVDAIGGNLNSTPLQWACRTGLVYVADYLIRECKADPLLTDDHGFNCLHSCIHSSNIMMVIYILFMTDIPIDSTDPSNRTSLHWAAYQGDMYSVKVLLSLGANPNAIDSIGFLPLHWALTRNVKSIFVSLLEKDTKLLQKTNDSKDAFQIASDMNCLDTLKTSLKEANIDIHGQQIRHPFSPNVAKGLTFFTPYLILPMILQILSFSQGYGFLKTIFSLGILAVQHLALVKAVIPCYVFTSTGKLMKSPYFAGVFSATAVWVTITWMFKLFPGTFGETPFLNFLFLTASACVFYTFYKSMTLDPGMIPPDTSRESVQRTINDLLKSRKFNDKNFCINTFVRIPLRAKYSYSTNTQVAKFDHSCPWVYNEVAVRNHKVFYGFIISLACAIMFFIGLAKTYFDELEFDGDDDQCSFLGEDFCTGYMGSPFVYNITIWSMLQMIWLSILIIGQSIQISKGLTTYEASRMNRFQDDDFYATPYDIRREDMDEPRTRSASSASVSDLATHSLLDMSSARDSVGGNTNIGYRILGRIPVPRFLMNFIMSSKTCKMLGISHFLVSTSGLIMNTKKTVRNNFNYGFKRNWLDFLFLRKEGDGYNIRNLVAIPVNGEGNLNGRLVDFYKLYSPVGVQEMV